MPVMEYYHNDINFHLQQLLDHVQNNTCGVPSQSSLISLFDRISTLPLAANREANFHLIYSEIFVYFRRLDPALIELGKAYNMFPNLPIIPIRQASLSASAGNFSDAIVFLGRAREADSQRGVFAPSMIEEIAKLEEEYRRQL